LLGVPRTYSPAIPPSNPLGETIRTFDTFAARTNFSAHSGYSRINRVGIAKHGLNAFELANLNIITALTISAAKTNASKTITLFDFFLFNVFHLLFHRAVHGYIAFS
jgi:hypothetical protein